MQKKKLHEAFKAQLNRKFFKTLTPQAQQIALRILLLTKKKETEYKTDCEYIFSFIHI